MAQQSLYCLQAPVQAQNTLEFHTCGSISDCLHAAALMELPQGLLQAFDCKCGHLLTVGTMLGASDWERLQARGWYAEAGIEVSFLSPEADGYKTTPAAKVRAGMATLAIAPTETVISSHRPRDTWKEQPRFKVGQQGLQDFGLHHLLL